jgi:hypothetical protein
MKNLPPHRRCAASPHRTTTTTSSSLKIDRQKSLGTINYQVMNQWMHIYLWFYEITQNETLKKITQKCFEMLLSSLHQDILDFTTVRSICPSLLTRCTIEFTKWLKDVLCKLISSFPASSTRQETKLDNSDDRVFRWNWKPFNSIINTVSVITIISRPAGIFQPCKKLKINHP